MTPSLAVMLALAWFAAAPTASQASNQTNIRFPISDTIFDPCTGELVDLDGSAHIVADVTINDNHAAISFHSNASENGVGETSGASYKLAENFSDHIEDNLVNGQFTRQP